MDVTYILAYYENPSMLELQFTAMRSMPDGWKKNVRMIVVDDGSPDHPAQPPKEPLGLPLQMFRMDVDVRWNQDACRNIGVKHSDTRWVLLTDMDHIPSTLLWNHVLHDKLDPTLAYRFSRVTAPEMLPYKNHPNSWLMTRELYNLVGGYDERYAGWYGTDGEFLHRVTKHARLAMTREFLIRYPRELVPDASTTRYTRKSPEDSEAIARIRAGLRDLPVDKRGPIRGRFPYHQTYPMHT